MQVVATAGHVDHGKSTLVRALTGMEPDRWAEERRRGLTIGLGFAWTDLPGGQRLALVDVPGHERFVPTMLAGVGPVPAVLFVVAADAGWMPQSAEHLAALDALGVRHGLLVVTRADLADPAPALARATEELAGTSLGAAGTPAAVVVSGRTGAGLPQLRIALARLAASLPAPDPDADVRLWVDRSFAITGAGTVATGTLAAGTIEAGDELEQASTGRRLRVRALHSTGEPVARATAVARVAVNLRGVEPAALPAGDALLCPGAWLAVDLVDVLVRAPAQSPLPAELMLHLGAAAVPVQVRPLGGSVVRLRLARALPLRVGDRVLLRDPGRRQVVGGADVLELRPAPLHRRGSARRHGEHLTALATTEPVLAALAAEQLRRHRFVPQAHLRACGLPLVGEALGRWRVDPAVRAETAAALPALVAQWCAQRPLEPGVPLEVAVRRLGLPDAALLRELAAGAGLSIVDGRVGRPEARRQLPPALERAVGQLTAELAGTPFRAPAAARLTQLGLGRRELGAAVRAGRLLLVADGVVLAAGADTLAARELAGLAQPFTVSAARQAWNTTRRVAVPLLELLDRRGLTESLPDGTRRLRPAGSC